MQNEIIDEALIAMQGRAPMWSEAGFTEGNTHGPMMVETLVTLGRPEAVMPWVERSGKGGPAAPPPHERIGADWRTALGAGDRYGDWQAFFRDELAEHTWPEVVGKWVGRFLPGMASAGAHGVIRVAHGVRSLTVGETEARLGELVDGLANWASDYLELPSLPRRAALLTPDEAIECIEFTPTPDTTTVQLRAIEQFPAFRDSADLVAVQGSGDKFLPGLLSTFARAYIATVRINPDRSTSAVHYVTVPSAVRLLLPYLHADERRSACLHAWHTAAALYATSGAAAVPAEVEGRLSNRDDLIDRAVALGNPHAVKFVEACWRAYDADGDVVLAAAAALAVEIYESDVR